MGLEIQHNQADATVQVKDEMTIYTVLEQRERLLPLITASKTITFDLSQVSEMDTAGAQLLLLVQAEAARQNVALTLVRHSNAVLAVFELLNLYALFPDPVVLPESARGSK